MTPQIFHAFEFVGQPDFPIPRLHIAYEWDLCLGRKGIDGINADDISRCLAGKEGPLAIDLEPRIMAAHVPMVEAIGNIQALNRIARIAQHTLGRKVSMYGLGPTCRDPYLASGVHAIASSCQRELVRKCVGEPEEFLEYNTFDLYRGPPSEWPAHDSSTALTIQTAKGDYVMPINVLMSPFRRDEGGGMIPLDLFRADLYFVASLLEPKDAITIWVPRASKSVVNGTEVWSPIQWDPTWEWLHPVNDFCLALLSVTLTQGAPT